MTLKLRKYEQALAILPGCRHLDKSVLYENLKYSGYRWSTRFCRWTLPDTKKGSEVKLDKYEQALAILPRCESLDRSALYDHLKTMGYRWNVTCCKWQLY